jgi:hypothetical protein
MSSLYRGSAIDASYQVSVHLAKRFQRRRFKKIGQSETKIQDKFFFDHVCLPKNNLKSNPTFFFGQILIINPSFLAHLAKGNVSFCHHFASIGPVEIII